MSGYKVIYKLKVILIVCIFLLSSLAILPGAILGIESNDSDDTFELELNDSELDEELDEKDDRKTREDIRDRTRESREPNVKTRDERNNKKENTERTYRERDSDDRNRRTPYDAHERKPYAENQDMDTVRPDNKHLYPQPSEYVQPVIPEQDGLMKLPFNFGPQQPPAALGMEVSGIVTTQIWTEANSPYYVIENLTVPFGETLTIEPGVNVIFNGSYNIWVEGNLWANGTSLKMINFTNITSGSPGDWGAIQFNNTANGRIYWANISYATNAIILNDTSAVVEIDYVIIFGSSSYGIIANAGGFNIHDNTFATLNYAIHIDIFHVNSGSFNTGDMIINDNYVLGVSGFQVRQINFQDPLPDSDIVVGQLQIINNTINDIANAAISIENYIVTNMQGGNLTWGEIMIIDNNITTTSGDGVYIDGDRLYNITNVNVTIGGFNISGNNITSTNNRGIYQDWGYMEELYGTTDIAVGQTIIINNVINADTRGIFLNWDNFGNNMDDFATISLDDTIISQNNIDSIDDCIWFDNKWMANYMYNDTSFFVGDFMINDNVVDSSTEGGIRFYSYSIGWEMYDNAMFFMGDVIMNNNHVTAIKTGIYYYLSNAAVNIYNDTMVYIGTTELINNTIDTTGGMATWGMYAYSNSIGYQTHGNAFVTFGTWDIRWNNISSEWGLKTGADENGYEMFDDSELIYYDWNIMHNTIDATNRGIRFETVDCGAYLYGNATETIGNKSVMYNNVTSQASFTYYLDYKYIGYRMYDNSTISVGWMDTSYNNFSSTGGEGMDLWIYDFGRHMAHNTSADFGDFYFMNNDIWSTNNHGINFRRFQNFAVTNEGNSSVIVGDVLVNYNNITTGLDGLIIGTFNTNGADLQDNSTALFGDFEFNNNTIDAGDDGIYSTGQFRNWGKNLYDYSQVTVGHCQLNDNTVIAGNEGINFQDYREKGYNMHGHTQFSMANVEICRNTINSNSTGIYHGNYEYMGYYLYDNASATISNFLFNNNIINATNDYGIYCYNIDSNGAYMRDNSTVTIGTFQWKNNKITGSAIDGIYIQEYSDNGYQMRHNTSVVLGDFEISDNWINTSGGAGIYFNNIDFCGYYMYDNTTFTMGDWLINDNTVWSNDDALYFDLQGFGHYMYGNSKANIGTNEITGNYFNSTTSYGLYSYWWYRFGENTNDNSSVSVGDCIIEKNNVSTNSPFAQALEAGPNQAGYNVYDNASVYFGNYSVSENTVYSGNYYGIVLYYYDIGYTLEPRNSPTCAATVVVGDFMVNDNDIYAGNADGMNLYFENCGYGLYGDASITLGSIELCRNTINAENGNGILFSDVYGFGSDMYDHSSFLMGDWLMNDNTILCSGTGIYYEPYEFGYEMYDNATATIGKNEISRNTINSTSSYGLYAWWWYEFGYNLYENATVTVGDSIIMNNNITANGVSNGIYSGPYECGYYVYDNSTATFGDYIISYNEIYCNNAEAIYIEYETVGHTLEPDYYSTCAASVIVGDFLLNNNEIYAQNNNGIEIQFQDAGYQLYDNAYVSIGDIEVCNNTVTAPSGDGIYLNGQSFGYYLYDNSSFIMGNWLFNDNTVLSDSYAIYFEPSSFANELYDYSKVTLGKNEILRNDLNSTSDYGIYAWWWYDFGRSIHENSKVAVGDCRIIENDIVANTSDEAIYTGPNSAGVDVYDNSSAIFGNYIVSGNTVVNNNGDGIAFDYYSLGGYLQPNMYSSCNSYVQIGDIKINNNDIISLNAQGIYFNYGYVGYSLYENASVLTGSIEINDNPIVADSYAIYLNSYRVGYNLYDFASATLGTFEIDNNDLNSTDDDCLSLYIQECFYDVNNNASFTHGDIFITDNTLKNCSVGIEYQLINCGFVIDNSTADIWGLVVTGNTVSASGDAFYYDTFQTPFTSSPNASQNYGDVTVSNNDLDSGSAGVYLEWGNPDYNVAQPTFFLSNNDIHDGIAGSTGIYMLNIFNSYLEDISLDNFDYGVYTNNSNINHMLNSSISNIGILDFNITSASYVYTINTTFDQSSVVYEDNKSQLDVAWFMNVQVNYQTDDPAPFANLTVYDTYSTEMFNSKTDANGSKYYLICIDYQENITGEIDNFNDYSAFADNSGMFGMAIPNPTMDQTRLVVITLLDLFKPTLINDSSDPFGTTGDLYHFNVNITDNLEMNATRAVYWFGAGAPQNVTMNSTGPYWLNITAPLNSIDQLHYYFSADDAFGNWLNTPQVDVPIYDNDAPYNLVDNSDPAAIMAEDFDFEANADDNIGVTEIHVVWWYDGDTGNATNTTMVGTGPYIHTLPVPVTGVDTLHYYFTVTDAAGNWITGPTVDLGVGDNVPPRIIIDSPANGTYVSGTIKIGLTASDLNSGLSYVAVWVITESEIYNSTPATSSFEVNFDTTTVLDGEYEIMAIAVDQRGMMNSTSIKINVDNTPPIVNAGPEENILVGETVDFDGSGCSDNTGIDTYNWSFTYDGKTQYLSGISPNFTFELEGDYTVTLTVTDVLGNFASNTMVVYVTKPIPPARPKVVSTNPPNNAQDVNVSSTVIITFDIPMDITSVDGVLDVSPHIGYQNSWNQDTTVLTITFTRELSYDTDYTITIGNATATTTGILQDAPFELTFSTEEEPIITPPNKKPKLTEGKVSPDSGDTETEFTFSVHYFDEDGDPPESVSVFIDGVEYNMILKSGEDGANGIFEFTTTLSKGTHSYYYNANDGKDDAISGDTTPILQPDALTTPNVKEVKEGEEDNLMLYLLIIIIIIIIIILLAMMMRRKKPAEEEEEPAEEEAEEEGKEEEEEETEETAEAGEFECPDCGATLVAGVTECPECGAEFEEDKELEDDEELPGEDEDEPVDEEEEPVAEEEEPVEEDEELEDEEPVEKNEVEEDTEEDLEE